MKTIILLTLFTFQALAQDHEVSGGGNGGDSCEQKILKVRNNIKEWIEGDGHLDLDYPDDITPDSYKKKMLDEIQLRVVSCVPGPILIKGVEKTCRNFIDLNNDKHIECDLNKFSKLNPIDRLTLIHHEYAGSAGFEVNNGPESDYRLTNQISLFSTPDIGLMLSLQKKAKPLPLTKIIRKDKSIEEYNKKTIYKICQEEKPGEVCHLHQYQAKNFCEVMHGGLPSIYQLGLTYNPQSVLTEDEREMLPGYLYKKYELQEALQKQQRFYYSNHSYQHKKKDKKEYRLWSSSYYLFTHNFGNQKDQHLTVYAYSPFFFNQRTGEISYGNQGPTKSFPGRDCKNSKNSKCAARCIQGLPTGGKVLKEVWNNSKTGVSTNSLPPDFDYSPYDMLWANYDSGFPRFQTFRRQVTIKLNNNQIPFIRVKIQKYGVDPVNCVRECWSLIKNNDLYHHRLKLKNEKVVWERLDGSEVVCLEKKRRFSFAWKYWVQTNNCKVEFKQDNPKSMTGFYYLK